VSWVLVVEISIIRRFSPIPASSASAIDIDGLSAAIAKALLLSMQFSAD